MVAGADPRHALSRSVSAGLVGASAAMCVSAYALHHQGQTFIESPEPAQAFRRQQVEQKCLLLMALGISPRPRLCVLMSRLLVVRTRSSGLTGSSTLGAGLRLRFEARNGFPSQISSCVSSVLILSEFRPGLQFQTARAAQATSSCKPDPRP